jgi:Leucine-rich repeat (LRR) protein
MKIYQLIISGNRLQSSNNFDFFMKMLGYHSHLADMQLAQCDLQLPQLESLQIQKPFLQALQHLTKNKRLSLAQNSLNSGGKLLKNFIKSDHCQLKELDLSSSQLGNTGTIALFEGMKSTNLHKLLLGGNKITDEGG